MITNFTEPALNKVNVPVVEMNEHKARLRRALLASPHWDGRSSRVKYKRLVLSGLVIAVLAIAMFTNATKIGNNSGSPLAYAKGLAKKGIQAVARLSTDEQKADEQKALEHRIHTDAEGILKEALNASDLKVETYAQVKKRSSKELEMLLEMMKGTINKDPAALKQATFLQFTGPEGGQVMIGFNEDNLPLVIKKAIARFDEAPSEPAPGLVKGEDLFDTMDGSVRGRTTIFSDTADDPGPKRVLVLFRVQEPNSGLKPLGDGKGWWLGPWETKTVEISGVSATLASNADTNTSDGLPEIWIKGSWAKDGKEYQMHSINITVDDFVKMANSVK